MRYYPRNRLDITYGTIARSLIYAFLPSRYSSRKKSESLWSPRWKTSAYFSVRTGFDLLLSSLPNIHPGDEVLMSAITIPAMWQLIHNRGLKVVPIDINYSTLAPCTDDIKRLITSRTKLLVITHLFGSTNNCDEIITFAKSKGIYIVEDCAQAYRGQIYHGNPLSDVSMFSFGPLKTASCLGGALLHFSNSKFNHILEAEMSKKENTYPKASRFWLLGRAFNYAWKIPLQHATLYFLFNKMLKILGIDIDELIVGSTRAFSKDDWITQIRMQPPQALYRLMYWRLSHYYALSVSHKKNRMTALTWSLGNADILPGCHADGHAWWLVPVQTKDPKSIVQQLRCVGVDASLVATALSCYPGYSTPNANKLIEKTVYVPLQHYMSSGVYIKALQILNLSRRTITTSVDWGKYVVAPVIHTTACDDSEIQQLIKNAHNEGVRISVRGRGKNMSDALYHEQKTYSLDMAYFTHIEIDIKSKTAVVGSGMTWDDVHRELYPFGLAPIAQQSSCDFTIGGSIAVGAHGRDILTSQVADTVEWVEGVDKTGAKRRIYYGDVEFKNLCSPLTTIIIMTRVKLRLTDNHLLQTSVEKLQSQEFFLMLSNHESLGEGLLLARPTLAPNDKLQHIQVILWRPVSGVVKQKTSFVKEKINYFQKIIYLNSKSSFLGATIRSLLEETVQLRQSGKVITRIEAMRPPVAPLKVLENNSQKTFDHPQEFFVPLENAEHFYEASRKILAGKILTGYTIRFVRGSLVLSGFASKHHVSFMIYQTTPRRDSSITEVRSVIRALAKECIKLGGRPYLAYAAMLDTDVILDAYNPKLEDIAPTIFESSLTWRIKRKLAMLQNKQEGAW